MTFYSRWWHFDLLDYQGDVAGGGMVWAASQTEALALADSLAGCCTVQLRSSRPLRKSA